MLLPGDLIINAARLAAEAHEGQQRYDGEPYINHPMRVAGMVTLCSKTTETMIAAAWLHDVIEDTDLSVDDLFDKGFPARVARWVNILTNVYTKDAYPDLDRKERKLSEHTRLGREPCYFVHTIKLADRYDNISKMMKSGRSQSWAKTYLRETWELVEALEYGDTQLRTLVIARALKTSTELKL